MTDIYERLKDAHSENAAGACEAALHALWERDAEIEQLRGLLRWWIEFMDQEHSLHEFDNGVDSWEKRVREALGDVPDA